MDKTGKNWPTVKRERERNIRVTVNPPSLTVRYTTPRSSAVTLLRPVTAAAVQHTRAGWEVYPGWYRRHIYTRVGR